MPKFQSKKLGQVFLQDKNVLEKIINTANIQPDNIVLEIGCGKGILSEAISKQAKQLYTVEIDEYYLDYTKNRLQESDNITFIHGDILKTKFRDIKENKFRIIANLPYQISSPLMELIVENKNRILPSILMLQRNFAEKLIAQPNTKAYSSISIFSQFYLDIKTLFNIPNTCFHPIPKVESSVISLTPRKEPLYKVDSKLFFAIIRSAFWGRRKTLANCLINSPYLDLPKEKVRELTFFKNKPKVRGEALSIEDFHKLYQEISLNLKNNTH